MSTEAVANGFKMHGVARSGFDAGGGSGLYDRARPTYPIEAITTILRESQPATGAPLRLVELGAGTGIASRMLLSQATTPSSDGTPPVGIASFQAIEPSAGMRSAFEKNISSLETGLVGELKRKGQLAPNAEVTVDEGTFEEFDAGTERDLVVIAQAFHWCSDFDLALTKAAGTLRKGGILALIWNLEDREAAPWVAKLRDIYEMHEDGTPQYRHNYWHSMYTTASYGDFFTADAPRHFSRALPTTLEGVKDRMKSKSYISVLSASEQTQLDEQVENLFRSLSDEELGRRWIDKDQGVWEYPYKTDLFLFRKK
ncbi:uncharacterized protein PFL1_02856 [Pseudozyma flocculosa PF-1]|uniref:Methyltransferase type 11 domain-containing protein n=2 Tax=Pseudozyma flocculosa TaxID=84751 RepID=A0A5C3F115_9BASI|nr:uncharacterized protein PFL1_02856 [Pseudozyma flocculosa PF-1]EPQ29637.1 hypothetical protein PFL1_02856 [Pseudozyma flocculosa PF-1]SPO38204.1 uncharacterized protein PSFLO_03681 [Pseudozyma flocculosa]